MLDPRIYRTGLIVAALALVVLAFSLRNQQTALNPTIAPTAFNAQDVLTTMQRIAQQEPSRSPGSPGDAALAGQISRSLRGDGFQTSTDAFPGQTVVGQRTLENVVGTRPGVQSASIVIVAPRDSITSPGSARACRAGAGGCGVAALSGTATLLELSRDLEGETLRHTIVLASISGSEGEAGALRLARTLPRPVDAVIALGDLAAPHPTGPFVIPWSNRRLLAPAVLRSTVMSALAAQTSLNAASPGLGAQFAHLALPLTLGQQGPFGAADIPAVELSLAGEAPPGVGAPVNLESLNGAGRAVLSAISAIDAARPIPAPSSYLELSGKIVPGWAIALFGLALIVPMAMAVIDGLARARRRGHAVWQTVSPILLAAIPFTAGALVVLVGGVLGALAITPPGPVPPAAIPITTAAAATLVVAILVFLAASGAVGLLVRRLPAPRVRRGRSPQRASDAAAVGLAATMVVAALVMWLHNPYAALLLVPALHLWPWAVTPGARLPLVLRLLLIAIGVLAPLLAVAGVAHSLGYGPAAIVWQGALLLAGHGMDPVSVLDWCVVLGCLSAAVAIAWLTARARRTAEAAPVTVRGPVTYAGPGSLGGTKSAIRR